MAKDHFAVYEQRVTPDLIRSKKGRQRITFITAYDFPTAKLADEAGFDMVLVGDTLAEVVLGHETTLPVTFEAMLHHTCAARGAIKRALLVADLPYGTYHASEEDAVRFATRFIKEGGAQAVKLEGGRKRVNLIHRMLDAEIPMMGYIGLTPQSVHRMGGYKVQGRIGADIEKLVDDAVALDNAGVFAMVLEGIPREVAKAITEQVAGLAPAATTLEAAHHWPDIFERLEKEKFRADLAHVTDREVQLLRALARSDDEEISVKEFDERYERIYFSRLSEKGLLMRTGRGRYKLYHPLFRLFLQQG
jgi:3-methyl-2-oxobutanoate hydroxymethyltransferase